MSEYASTPSTGKLKLKGSSSSSSGITKKKKKKQPSTPLTTSSNTLDSNSSSNPKPEAETNDSQHQDRSVVLAALADEDSQLTKHSHRNASIVDGKQLGEDVVGAGIEDEDPEEANALKTEAERKFGERRRKMVSQSSPSSVLIVCA